MVNMAKIIPEVKINQSEKNYHFDPHTFRFTKTVSQDHIEVMITIQDAPPDTKFGVGYYLDFFGYLERYSGWYVCSQVLDYGNREAVNAQFMRIIPYETRDTDETFDQRNERESKSKSR